MKNRLLTPGARLVAVSDASCVSLNFAAAGLITSSVHGFTALIIGRARFAATFVPFGGAIFVVTNIIAASSLLTLCVVAASACF